MDGAIISVLSIVSVLLVSLTAAIGVLWTSVNSSHKATEEALKNCEQDRKVLTDKVNAFGDTMGQVVTVVSGIVKSINEVNEHLEAIDARHEKAFSGGGDKKIETKTS